MNEKYSDIINLPHRTSSTHPQMKRGDRAAQFAPYAALSGYEDAVEETARLTDSRTELDDYEKEKINATLIALASAQRGRRAVITYFRPDERKPGGAYITATGEVARIDEVEGLIVLVGGYVIRIEDILDITILK